MPKRAETDEVVEARLRSVLSAPAYAETFTDRRPVSWSELIPSWPADVDLAPAEPAESPPPEDPAEAAARASIRKPWGRRGPTPDSREPSPEISGYVWDDSALSRGGDDHSPGGERLPPGGGSSTGSSAGGGAGSRLSAAGAFSGRLSAFDPGRPGVKALGAVALLVVLVAGFLAWQSRPRTEAVGAVEPSHESVAMKGAQPPPSSPASSLVVAVGGKVARPGLVKLPAGARVADALKAAGGARPGVDPSRLNLARKVVDGELIMVGEAPPSGAAAGPSAAAAGGAGGPVNLNLATLSDLDELPGVGPVLAQRILDAREAQGGFRAVADLRKVSGIGGSRYEQLKDLVTV